MFTNAPIDTRAVEKLLANLRYELDPNTGGCSSSEEIQSLLETVHEVLIDPPGENGPDADLTDADMDRIHRNVCILAEHLVLALVESGHYEKAHDHVEAVARTRRRCDAKFSVPRAVPLTWEERETLAAEWDESSRAEREANPDLYGKVTMEVRS
jgi:hypothetical protein